MVALILTDFVLKNFFILYINCVYTVYIDICVCIYIQYIYIEILEIFV